MITQGLNIKGVIAQRVKSHHEIVEMHYRAYKLTCSFMQLRRSANKFQQQNEILQSIITTPNGDTEITLWHTTPITLLCMACWSSGMILA